MEVLRDWLIQRGWSEESARLVAIAAAIVISIIIGWLIRALAKVPLDKVSESWKPWRDALKRFHVLARMGWVIVTIAASELVLPLLEPWSEIS